MPSVVRFIAFSLIGRALCVTCRPTSSTKHHRDGDEKTAERQANSDVQESLLGETAMSNVVKSSSEIIDKINDVLDELRKVTHSIFTALRCRPTLSHERNVCLSVCPSVCQTREL